MEEALSREDVWLFASILAEVKETCPAAYREPGSSNLAHSSGDSRILKSEECRVCKKGGGDSHIFSQAGRPPAVR